MSTHSPYSQLTLYQVDPLNAGTPLEALRHTFLTPQDLFYIRSHGSCPIVNRDAYRLVVNGMVQQNLEISFDDLLTQFAQYTITTTLVCAGSRRKELATIRPFPGQVPWDADFISTARWRGVRLSDVLQVAGIEPEARYVAFYGLDEADEEGERISFGSSVRVEKAISPEVLLAYEMNDSLLAPEHGYPLRVLIPGYMAARSVKWLQTITLQNQPSTNYFQDRDYKLFPSDTTAETVDWTQGKVLEEIGLNSVICTPYDRETRKAGPMSVQGYAITGEEATIEHIELSIFLNAASLRAEQLLTLFYQNMWRECVSQEAPKREVF